jgi:hypothetical protein
MNPTDNSPCTPAELSALEGVTSRKDWDHVVTGIKLARHGEYPRDWYDRVLRPGGILERLDASPTWTGEPLVQVWSPDTAFIGRMRKRLPEKVRQRIGEQRSRRLAVN